MQRKIKVQIILLPLLIVVNLICSLSCDISTSQYQKRVLGAREATLRDNLFQMRKMIDQYAADKGALPQSLDDLIRAGYMHEIPVDPITQKKDWRIVMGDDPMSNEGGKGIVDVRSASTAKSSEGTSYSEW